MQRVKWQNGEIISAEHFFALEDWVVGQISRRPIVGVGMGLLSQGGRGAALARTDEKGQAACGPLRAVTRKGALLELPQAIPVELHRASIGSEWRTLFLIIREKQDKQEEQLEASVVHEEGRPVMSLPSLLLSTAIEPGDDYLPVARIRVDAKNILLDGGYVPPCLMVDGDPRLSEEVSRWRDLLRNISDQTLAFSFRYRENTNAARDVQTMTFLWTLCTSEAPALDDRPLTAERFFRIVGRFAAEYSAILAQPPVARPLPEKSRTHIEYLTAFDASTSPVFADAVAACKELRTALRNGVQVANPEQPTIRQAGTPTVTHETKPDRWKVLIPLAAPLGEMVRGGDRILVAFKLRNGTDVGVRVHPTESWSAVTGRNRVVTEHDTQDRHLDGHFNTYFLYLPDEDGLKASQIVFQLQAEPTVDTNNPVLLEVDNDV